LDEDFDCTYKVEEKFLDELLAIVGVGPWKITVKGQQLIFPPSCEAEAFPNIFRGQDAGTLRDRFIGHTCRSSAQTAPDRPQIAGIRAEQEDADEAVDSAQP
jgi:hypothetical protein